MLPVWWNLSKNPIIRSGGFMAISANVNQYLENQYEGMSPNQLILMLYKGAIERLALAREGIIENDPQKRGENLGKAIAIISELNSCLKSDMKDDGTEFLRGLYSSILMELPKVSIDNNIETLDRADRYMKQLMDIWKKDVMGLSEDVGAKKEAPNKDEQKVAKKAEISKKPGYGRVQNNYGGNIGAGIRSFSV